MSPIYLPNQYDDFTTIEQLIEEVPWQSVKAMRKESFMSPVTREYQYDKGGHIYTSEPFMLEVQQIMVDINYNFGYNLNICFLNYYENDKNALGWHADDTHPMDHNEPIAVVSFGAERDIWWKPQDYKGEIPQEWRQKLGNGSLFIMPPGFQEGFYHKIPKNDRPCGPRISLTFRRYAD